MGALLIELPALIYGIALIFGIYDVRLVSA